MAKVKALIVDDNKDIADYMVRMLGLLNIDAEPAYGARLAIFSLKKRVPDIVFLDINMPGVTGFDVLGFINREPKLKQTRVMVVSSDDQPEIIDRAYQHGALEFIVKPVNLDILETILKKHAIIS